MELLKAFRKRANEEESNVHTLPLFSDSPIPAAEQTVESESNPSVSKPLTVSYATGWPIDIIYGYLRKDYSEQGYNDAISKSDTKFMEMNMSIIKNRILMTFREVKLNYDAMYKNIDTRIQTSAQAGLLSVVSDLEQNKSIIDTHLEELAKLKEEFTGSNAESAIPLQTYQCGFLKGLAVVMLGAPATPKTQVTDYNFSQGNRISNIA